MEAGKPQTQIERIRHAPYSTANSLHRVILSEALAHSFRSAFSADRASVESKDPFHPKSDTVHIVDDSYQGTTSVVRVGKNIAPNHTGFEERRAKSEERKAKSEERKAKSEKRKAKSLLSSLCLCGGCFQTVALIRPANFCLIFFTFGATVNMQYGW